MIAPLSDNPHAYGSLVGDVAVEEDQPGHRAANPVRPLHHSGVLSITGGLVRAVFLRWVKAGRKGTCLSGAKQGGACMFWARSGSVVASDRIG